MPTIDSEGGAFSGTTPTIEVPSGTGGRPTLQNTKGSAFSTDTPQVTQEIAGTGGLTNGDATPGGAFDIGGSSTGSATNTGIIGPVGPQGQIGPIGPSGPAGTSNVPGPQGDPGVTGAPGAQGPIGPDGQDGPPGPQGNAGPIGGTGSTGNRGATGPQGPQGVDGSQGIKGDTGTTGSDGHAGAQGIPGPAGDQGGTGSRGPMGTTGSAGPAGTQGIPGSGLTTFDGVDNVDGSVTLSWTGPGIIGSLTTTDLTGATGSQGVPGVQGPVGPTVDDVDSFDQGGFTRVDFNVLGTSVGSVLIPDGADGTPGTDGVNGTNGTDGIDGIDGTNGMDGTPGTDGTDGTPGTNGDDGAAGIDGTNGTNGMDGAPGEDGTIVTALATFDDSRIDLLGVTIDTVDFSIPLAVTPVEVPDTAATLLGGMNVGVQQFRFAGGTEVEANLPDRILSSLPELNTITVDGTRFRLRGATTFVQPIAAVSETIPVTLFRGDVGQTGPFVDVETNVTSIERPFRPDLDGSELFTFQIQVLIQVFGGSGVEILSAVVDGGAGPNGAMTPVNGAPMRFEQALTVDQINTLSETDFEFSSSSTWTYRLVVGDPLIPGVPGPTMTGDDLVATFDINRDWFIAFSATEPTAVSDLTSQGQFTRGDLFDFIPPDLSDPNGLVPYILIPGSESYVFRSGPTGPILDETVVRSQTFLPDWVMYRIDDYLQQGNLVVNIT